MGKFVDVSEHNTIDWAKAQKDVGAAYIRCGLRGSLAKTAPQDYKKIRADEKWAENLRAVQEYGIPFGPYYFPTAITAEEAVEGAEWFYEQIKDLEMTYPPMLDSEHVWGKDKEPGRANSLSREERTRLLKVVTDYFNARGLNIGIYASASWLTSKLDMSAFPQCVRDCTWVADSTGAVDYDGYYWLHQYGKGPVAGSAKDIDLNRICGAVPEVMTGSAPKGRAFPVTDPVRISNSGSDEHGTYKGGKAGDQTGREWCRRDWYDRPWNCVLRHPDAAVRACIAELAAKAADNDLIGYDQYQRQTYWAELQKAGFDPGKIRTACEADCSAGVIANVRAAGYILGRKELQNISATYTGNMRSSFKKAGFRVLTDSKYTGRDDYLLAGDVLLNDAHHTATVITNGRLSGSGDARREDFEMLPILTKGSKGTAVKWLQIALGGLTVDGDFGDKTLVAVKAFQTRNGLTVDGEVGPKTWAALIDAIS